MQTKEAPTISPDQDFPSMGPTLEGSHPWYVDKRGSPRIFALGVCLAGAALAAYVWHICSFVTINYDYGWMALGADLLIRSGLLYSDVHTELLPGTYLLLALIFKAFGSSMLVTQVATAVSILVVGALLIALSRHFLSGLTAIVPAAVTLIAGTHMIPYFSYHWLSLLWLLSFSLCLMKAYSDPHDRPISFAAGLMGGFTVVFYQVQILPVACGLLALYLALASSGRRVDARRCLLLVLGGVAVVLSGLTMYLFATGTLFSMLDCTIGFVLTRYGAVNGVPYGYNNLQDSVVAGFAPLFALCAALPYGLLKCAPFVVVAAALTIFIFDKSRSSIISRHPHFFILLALAIGLWIGGLHKPDLRRLIFVDPLMLICLFYFAEKIKSRFRSAAYIINTAMVLLAVGLVLNAKAYLRFYPAEASTYDTRRGLVRSTTDLRVVEVLRSLTSPGEKVLVYPYDTGLAFLTKTDFPGRNASLQYRYHTREQFQSVIDDMEQSQVRYVVWNRYLDNQNYREMGWPSYVPVPKDELIMEPYLNKNYDFIGHYGIYWLMRRRVPNTDL